MILTSNVTFAEPPMNWISDQFDAFAGWMRAHMSAGDLRDLITDGALAGAVMSDAFPPMPITSVKVAGAKITLTITAPDGSEATINMELKGDDVTGDWSMPNDGSKIVGKKLP